LIFTTIADDATKSGKRIVTEFEKARQAVKDLENIKFSFDDTFSSQLESDKNALIELQELLINGQTKTQDLISSTLTQNASKEAFNFANKADFQTIDIDTFVNDQKKAHIAMLAMDKSIERCAFLIDGYNQALKRADGSHQAFIDGISSANQQLGRYLTDLGGTEGSIEGYQGALKKASIETAILKAKTIALNMAVTALATIGFQILGTVITNFITANERARESAEEAAHTYSNAASSIESYADEINDLRTKLDSGTLSEMDAYQAKQSLLDIQNKLSSSYGEQAAGIDLVNGKLETQIGLVRQLTQADADKFLNENAKAIAKAEKKMTEQKNWYLGEYYQDYLNDFERETLDHLIEKHGDNLRINQDSYSTRIYFEGDVSQAETVLNDFMTDIRNAEDKYGESNVLSDFFDSSSTYLSQANKVLEDYQDIYVQAQEARLVADRDEYGTTDANKASAAKWLSDYALAIEEYNNALASGDEKKITDAANKFNAMDSAVQALLQSSGMSEYSEQFEEARSQLNETAIAQREFNDQLKDEQKSVKEHADALKELQMTEAQFLSISIDTSSVVEGTEDVRALIAAAQDIGLISKDATQAEIENFARSLVNSGVLIGSAVEDATKKSFDNIFKGGDNSLSDQLSTELEKIDTLKEAMKSVMSGEFDNEALFALMEDFPDAINHTGNMMEFLKIQIEDIIGKEIELADGTKDTTGIIGMLDDAIAEAADNPDAVRSLTQLKDLVLELAYATAEDFTINIEVEKSSLDALRTALDEARSAAGLTQESVEALQNRYKGLAGFNPLELFESTNTGLYLNNGVLADLEEAYEKNRFEKIGNQLAYLKEQLVYAGSGAEHDFILEQITKLELLEAQYVGLTSEYNKWTQAQSSANDRDMYEAVTGGKESVGKLIEQGWAKSDDVTSYLKLLTGKEIDDLTAQQIKELYESLEENIDGTKFSIFDFFTTDKDGNVTSDGVANFFDAVKQKLEGTELGKSVLQEDGIFNFLGDNMQNVADELGISVELMEILLRAAQEAGAKVEFNSMFTGLDEGATKVDTLKKKLDELNKTYVEIDIYTNKENIASEIDKAAQEYQKALQSGDKDLQEYYGAAIDTLVARKNYKNFMGVDTSQLEGDMKKGMDLLQKWQTAKNKAEAAGEKGDEAGQAEANQEVVDLVDQINQLPEEIKTKLGFEGDEDATSFLDKIEQGTVEVDIKAILSEANKSDIQMMYEMNGKTLTANMNVEGNAKEVVDAINGLPESKTITIDAKTGEGFQRISTVVSGMEKTHKTITIDAEPGSGFETVKSSIDSIGVGLPDVQINVNLDSTSKTQTTNDINAIGSDKAPVSIGVELDGTESTVTTTINDIGSDKSSVKIGVELDGTQTAVAASINDIGANAQPATITVTLDPTTQSQVTEDINAIGSTTPSVNVLVNADKTDLDELDSEVSKQRTANVVTIVYSGQLNALDQDVENVPDADITVNVFRDKFDTLKSELETGLDTEIKVTLNPEDPLGEIKQYAGQRDSNTNPNGTPKDTGGVTNNPQNSGSSSYGLGSQVTFENPLEEVEDTEANLEVNVEGQEDVDLMIESINALQDHQFEAKGDTQGQEKLDQMKDTCKEITDVDANITANVSGEQDVVNINAAINVFPSGAHNADVTANVSGLSEVKAMAEALEKIAQNANINVNVSGSASVSGSAFKKSGGSNTNRPTASSQAIGTAYARGYWGTQNSGKALVGELGQEILVRDGHFYTVGDTSAEVIKYKKGDIIFNHVQSKEILEHGRILHGQKRAHTFAGGTAFATGNAFAGSTIGGTKVTTDEILKKSTSKKTSSSNKSSSKKSSSKSKEDTEETFDWIEIAIDRIERAIDNLELKATSAFRTWGSRTSNLRKQMSKVTDEIKLQQKAYNRYIQEANSVGLDAHYAKLVRNGAIDIETIDDEDLIEQIKEYQEWYEKALDCAYAVDELNESLAELYQQNFDNVVAKYEGMLSIIEHEKSVLEESISQAEEQGYIASVQYYEALMERERNNINKLTEQRNKMQAALSEAVASGTIAEYSEAWYEMNSQINDVTLSIEEANTAMIEYNNSIRDIEWEIFDLMQEKIGHVVEETEFLVDLLSSDKLHEDGGQLTEEGMATMGLHGMAYNTHMEQAKRYAQELKEIEQDIANDPHNQNLLERRQELLEAQRDSILAAEDERQAIVDLVQEGIDLELEALEERIDKYNESLESAKDLYEYQKRIKEQTQEIAVLEKQMMAYQGDDSEETKAKIQQIKVDLESARDELEETEYDHYIEDTEKMLDDLLTEYEELLNMRLDDVDALISDMIDRINQNSDTINNTLHSLAAEFGYEVSDIMKNTWMNDGQVVTVYDNDIMNSITNAATSLSNELQSIDDGIWQMVATFNEAATSDIEKTHSNTRGYASGAYRISKNQLAWTQEGRDLEAIIRPSDGAILTPLARNDSVLNASATANLFDFANNPSQFIKDNLDIGHATDVHPYQIVGNTYDNDFSIQIALPNVSNYEQFKRELQQDKSFERMIKAMTTDRLFGGSSISKYKY